ncbi:uncharacterized protein LOC143022998 [Oratosquilla oratoria]|uniref:uncharacterized protein LOC143022998 n=1 Tax=Oratosquilla oratoria TaxID=337810 RepID=UPI003F75B2DC
MVEQFEGVKNRLEATEKKTVEIEEECKLLKNNGVNGKEGIVTAPLGDMGRLENKIAKLEELRDEEARKNNIVIQGVPESAAEERRMRNKEDADFLKELFVGAMELDSNALVINKMFRLGTMNENSTRPRPLLVGFDSESLKNMGKDEILVGCIYRSPNSEEENNSNLRKLIKEAIEMNTSHVLITGDFNFPEISWQRWTTQNGINSEEYLFLETLRDTYMFQHVKEVTRGRGTDNPSLLDLVLTNEEDMINSVTTLSPLGKSDHSLLKFDYNCYIRRIPTKRQVFFYDKGDYEAMRKDFPQKWTEKVLKIDGLEDKWSTVKNKLKEVESIYVPSRTYDSNLARDRHRLIKLDEGTKMAIKKKNRSWSRYMETKNSDKLQEYKKWRNKEPDGELPHIPVRNFDEPLNDCQVKEEDVWKKLGKLKVDKSPGPDNINARILKELRDNITPVLTELFETSIREGKLPEDWKSANVSAIHKGGDKSEVNNYRPVSLTCITCKVLESIIRDHIMEHMTRNDLFSDSQFGFLTGRSTVLQLLHVIDKWTRVIDDGGETDAIFLHFQKAFDKVPHQRLLRKLAGYGVGDDTKIFRGIKNEEDRHKLQENLDSLQEWSRTWLMPFHPQKCKHMKFSSYPIVMFLDVSVTQRDAGMTP